LDVSTAFLNASLDDDTVIFMRQPAGFDDGSGRVCRLKKSLYGLKQAGRLWNLELSGFLLDLGFKKSTDPCIFVREDMVIAIYVDDILVCCKGKEDCDKIFEAMSAKWKMTNDGELTRYLGMEVKRTKDGILLHQEDFIRNMLSLYRMEDAKDADTPMIINQELSQGGKPLDVVHSTIFRSLLGQLLYLTTATRPDIAFVTASLARYQACPTTTHLTAAKHVLRYLKKTRRLGIWYSATRSSSEVLECYTDATWAADVATRKSQSGFLIYYRGGLVDWGSKLQRCVALSSCESELVAATIASTNVRWIQKLMSCLEPKENSICLMRCDNQSTISIVKNPVSFAKSKHISMKYFYVRDLYGEGVVKIVYVRTDANLADLLTKALGATRFNALMDGIGLRCAKPELERKKRKVTFSDELEFADVDADLSGGVETGLRQRKSASRR
jgi:Reverse transcriptase (RNA-dependent DNA polymerase)